MGHLVSSCGCKPREIETADSCCMQILRLLCESSDRLCEFFLKPSPMSMMAESWTFTPEWPLTLESKLVSQVDWLAWSSNYRP